MYIRFPRHPAEPPTYAVCFDPNTVTLIKTVATVAATVFQASNTLDTGTAEKAAAKARAAGLEHEAAQAEQKAGQERAASQRAAFDQRRKARLLESKALALASASGAGAGDPTVENLLGDIGAEGEFRGLNELALGEQRALSLETQAGLKKFEARQERRAGDGASSLARSKAIAQVFAGGAKAFGVLDEGGVFDKDDEEEAEKKTTTTAGAGRTFNTRFG